MYFVGRMTGTVIKLGGSLLFDETGRLKADYLKAFLRVLSEVDTGDSKKIVVVGGGATARRYITVAREVCSNESALDQLGIIASRLNASLLFTMYYGKPPLVPSSLEELMKLYYSDLPVIFTGGLQPGQSTTTVSALVAEATRSRLIIATDVDGVFTADPKKDPSAKLLEEVDVDWLIEMFANPQKAGEYRLFDLLTLQIIKRSRIETRVLNGYPPENIKRALEGQRVGTLIVFP
ncbi:UMP kinase [Infirmifilum sp. NZ]|uniref:UMP kinase n=1 Tax=Infirmifilum sp. NZ TaxID=2926850 RepID=UPI00279B21E8|nr:UMP kinase [Infirmifilum sp. NZ]UNQ72611.1 UMP kinase [Infirmifilum sp. NZ]